MTSILDIFNKYSKEALVGYFLVVWGLGDFVDVIWGLFHLGGFRFSTVLDILWIVLDLASGAILVALGLRILNESNQN